MRHLFLILTLSLSILTSYSQENVTANVTRNGNKVSLDTSKDFVFLYDEPLVGVINFKDKTSAKAKLNINLLTNEVMFVNDKGTLISIDNQDEINFLSIGKDIFFNSSNGLIQVIANVNDIKLGITRQFKTKNSETSGAYGMPSSTASTQQISSLVDTRSSTPVFAQLSVGQKVELGYSELFYLIKNDKFFHITSAKQFSKVYSIDKKKLENYIEDESLNLKNRDDVLKLYNFCNSNI